MEARVERLQHLDLRYRFKEDGASGAVTDLIFAPYEELQLWQRFPSVTFVYCTYKTGRKSLSGVANVEGEVDTKSRSSLHSPIAYRQWWRGVPI